MPDNAKIRTHAGRIWHVHHDCSAEFAIAQGGIFWHGLDHPGHATARGAEAYVRRMAKTNPGDATWFVAQNTLGRFDLYLR